MYRRPGQDPDGALVVVIGGILEMDINSRAPDMNCLADTESGSVSTLAADGSPLLHGQLTVM
jgi:hypothetical protein